MAKAKKATTTTFSWEGTNKQGKAVKTEFTIDENTNLKFMKKHISETLQLKYSRK